MQDIAPQYIATYFKNVFRRHFKEDHVIGRHFVMSVLQDPQTEISVIIDSGAT